MTRNRPTKSRRPAQPTHSHSLRPAVPVLDFDGCADNGCNWPNCQTLAAWVHTYRVGSGINARHRGRLLCAKHARAVDNAHALHIVPPPPPDTT